ncbi:MAG: hypothetical protein O7H41_01815 [Planctomycetota bacterium]|nr:hypothetical protein [Planctomycetota bacterium]
MKGTTLTPSNAVLLEATSDPRAYIERFLVIHDMVAVAFPILGHGTETGA